jgi:hypothetical protein
MEDTDSFLSAWGHAAHDLVINSQYQETPVA